MSDEPSRSLDDDLEREIEQALGDASLLGIGSSSAPTPTGPGGATADGTPEPGHFADATVSGVAHDDVFVEFGPRAQGVIPADQFGAPPEIGETVRVYVERFDTKEGLYLCALKRTLQAAAGWGSVEPGAIVMATTRAVNRGGLEVQIGHLSGFLPASHVALEHIDDLETVVGQTFPVEVIEADPDRRRLVVSRRAILARERDQHATATLDRLQIGDVLSGTVVRVERFGAFVDIGGIDGLVHVSQLAWKRVAHPDDVVKQGDTVKVQILDISISSDEKRISLGMKQLTEDPWMRFARDHAPGSVMEGRVTRLAHFGAFIEIADGIEGLAHISQLAPDSVGSVREVLKLGDTLAVRVVDVDVEKHRIGLSLLTERGDRLTDDVADDETIREVLDRKEEDAGDPTIGDLLRRALDDESRNP